MTAPETPALAGMSIGAVLDLLRPDFPDVTISKIRFLEAEGLVTPQRAASGYRRFTAYDCARLRFVLTAQRDQYLPLKVIKAQLDAQPDGELPLAGSPYGVPRLVSIGDDAPAALAAESAAVAATRIRLSREDLLERSGVDGELLTALLKAGVITTGPRASSVDSRTVCPSWSGSAKSGACAPAARLRAAMPDSASIVSSRLKVVAIVSGMRPRISS